MIASDIKQKIDAMSYEQLLRFWRNSPCGHPWFTDDEVYSYYRGRMKQLRDGGVDHVAASKSVGWNKE